VIQIIKDKDTVMSLTDSQYNEIMREYDSRRSYDMRVASDRLREVEDRIPRIRDIRREVCELTGKVMRDTLLNGSDSSDALSEMSSRLHELSLEKERLIKEAGFPDGYLDPPYICPDCKDTGYVDGKKCHCLRQKEFDIAYSQSHLKSYLADQSFDDFSLSYYDDKNASTGKTPRQYASLALKGCKTFAENFHGKGSGNLLLHGPTGTGKTMLANCVARQVLRRGFSVIYFTAYSFFELMSDRTFGRESGEDDRDYDNLMHADLVILDDLGSEATNRMTVTHLFNFLNERIISASPVLITTNLTMDELMKRYSDRIFSRIIGSYSVYTLLGSDIRILKRYK